MEFFYWLILASFVIPLIWAIASAATTAGVQKKFAGLGVLAGKTKEEILQAVGVPNSISSIGAGKEVLQWQTTGYHIALIFTNEICDGVSHEFSA